MYFIGARNDAKNVLSATPQGSAYTLLGPQIPIVCNPSYCWLDIPGEHNFSLSLQQNGHINNNKVAPNNVK